LVFLALEKKKKFGLSFLQKRERILYMLGFFTGVEFETPPPPPTPDTTIKLLVITYI